MKKIGRSVGLLHCLFHHVDLLFCWWCTKTCIEFGQLKLELLMDCEAICIDFPSQV